MEGEPVRPDRANSPLRRYEESRYAGYVALQEGHVRESERLYAEALRHAREAGDSNLNDLAYCNWASVKIGLGETDEILSSLREILVRNGDPNTGRLAAHSISRIYELRGERQKGLFYARVARDRTAQIAQAEPSWIAGNLNQMGNCLVADSRFEEALAQYEEALLVQPDHGGYRTPALRQNLGYCHLMLGHIDQAFSLLFSSLKTFRRLHATSLLALNHLDLAYAYLEINRPRTAIRHAERALALTREYPDESNLKNALYLLGEAFHMSGNDEAARRHFEQLSDRYDNLPFIADFLLTVDVRQMINLRA